MMQGEAFKTIKTQLTDDLSSLTIEEAGFEKNHRQPLPLPHDYRGGQAGIGRFT